MPLGDGTRESIEAAVERLEERFGEVPVERVEEVDDPETFEHGVEVAERHMLGGGGAWVTDRDGRVLFIRHPNSPEQWGLPGGGYEPGETLVETARREVREETGVEVQVTGVRELTHRHVRHRDDPDREFHVFDAWLAAEPVEAGAEPDPDPADWEEEEEILEARWFEEPPETVHERFEEWVAEWTADQ